MHGNALLGLTARYFWQHAPSMRVAWPFPSTPQLRTIKGIDILTARPQPARGGVSSRGVDGAWGRKDSVAEKDWKMNPVSGCR